MSTKKIVGLLMSVLGAIGVMYSATTISNDTSGWIHYTYAPPFTEHELTVLAILVVSFIVLINGIVMLLTKERNNH